MKRAQWISVLATLLLFSTASNAGILLMEDFNDGVADGWDLSAGADPAALVTDPVNATLALGIETRFTQSTAATPSFDLTGATFVRIMFDYAAGGAPPSQATRFVDLEFFDGSSWVFLDRIRQNTPNSTLMYEVNAGFSTDNQFRFLGYSNSGGSKILVFDNVIIESDVMPVPAPSSLALFAAAGLLLLRRRVVA